MEEPAGIERVRDEPEPEIPSAERFEQRVGRRSERARRLPGGVLGLEEAPELLIRDLDPEVAEQLAHEPRILDLLERARHPEERLVLLAEVRRDRARFGEPVAPERLEPRPVPRLDERLVVAELHQRVSPVEENGSQHPGYASDVARKILWASLALAPLTFLADYALHLGDVPLFVLAAIALVPLAWVIGEATEHAAYHTGPGIGGFLNATFGNAPELIISLLAVNKGLTDVVRGSLTGSVVSNILLVLGLSLLVAPRGRHEIDRESSFMWLALVLVAVLAFLVPAVPSWHGDRERHTIAVLSAPISALLLVVYVGVTWWQLRRHRRGHVAPESVEGVWRLSTSVATLAGATVVTAWVAEILVDSIDAFARRAHLSDFFVAAVIVAIVGNAAEHGGALVVASRGNVKLATEIALSSSAQVAVFLIPAVALLAWAIKPLALAFRPVELIAVGGSALCVAGLFWHRRCDRRRGLVLIGLYAAAVVAFYVFGP